MPLYVIVAICPTNEALLAMIATVWPLTRVNQVMSIQTWLEFKSFFTIFKVTWMPDLIMHSILMFLKTVFRSIVSITRLYITFEFILLKPRHSLRWFWSIFSVWWLVLQLPLFDLRKAILLIFIFVSCAINKATMFLNILILIFEPFKYLVKVIFRHFTQRRLNHKK